MCKILGIQWQKQNIPYPGEMYIRYIHLFLLQKRKFIIYSELIEQLMENKRLTMWNGRPDLFGEDKALGDWILKSITHL